METKLKTIKLQGKDYVQVAERIKYFRETYKDGSIQTEYQILDTRVIFTARIYDGNRLVATGHSLKPISAEYLLEKGETRAIGRALGIAGIGIDCGVSTYEEAREYFETEKPKFTFTEVKERAKKEMAYDLVSEYCKKNFKHELENCTQAELSKVVDLLDGRKE